MFISSRPDATHQCEELKTCPSGRGTSRFEVFCAAPAAMADDAAPSILCELLKAEEGGSLVRTESRREAGVEDGPSLVRTASGREAEDGHRRGKGGGAPWVGEVGAGRRGGRDLRVAIHQRGRRTGGQRGRGCGSGGWRSVAVAAAGRRTPTWMRARLVDAARVWCRCG